ncbi:thioredoxin [Dysgonomonas sp. 511]|uniref:thioredoxin n=1 Tax=Dysgonomonas sp. 511 TaxID=2302930 RepID=UPI0013D78BA2|nr:thioredoxin [Dysgonomonas sp. 511]NDV77357.1 thioredoxin [Dysgonomonas sp. 511]
MKNKIFVFAASAILFLSASAPLAAQGAKAKEGKPEIVTLSASNYGSEVKNGIVLVDFWAAWCRPCRMLAPVLEEVAKDYSGTVRIGKLNVENYKKFASDMGIEALPTIIVYKNGKEVQRIKGLVKKEELVRVVEKYSDK